jgi:hypothetical protein
MIDDALAQGFGGLTANFQGRCFLEASSTMLMLSFNIVRQVKTLKKTGEILPA